MPIDRRLRSSLLTVAALTAALAARLPAQGIPIGFEETFALAPDRSRIVDSLIPGTDDFYYYHCRERLDVRDFATVDKVLPIWIDRHGRNARVIEIENRAALLGYGEDPARTFTFLRDRLGVSYGHQRIVPGAKSTLPDHLDPALLSPIRLTQQALAQYRGTVQGFTTRALAGLAAMPLDANTLRNLLSRLDRPDVDNLPALIVRDLDYKNSSGFGSMAVHDLLRLPQLEECIRLRPALLREPKFVDAYLTRLRPDADLDWHQDPDAYQAQLARLHEFAQRLSPAFNSLKAQVLYRWLEFDLTQGSPDKDRFLAYIRLPRRSGYPAESHLRRYQNAEDFVDTNRGYATDLPIIGDDTQLVQACLEHFFAREDSYDAYADFLDTNWLKVVLAETKILLGQGDMERWYSMLNNPARLAALEQRVELEFPPTQKRFYGANDPVTLSLDTKNIKALVVKVFAIDAYRYQCEKQRPVDATIELDGIVANDEQTYSYDEPPLRRVRRTFDLPALREPGTYVVEFVGNGTSSRAVIHKGDLRMVERTAAAGHLLRVYDDGGKQQQNAVAWFGGREYPADDHGEILVPFSTDPGAKQLVLRAGPVASIVPFSHRAESYALHDSVFVDRESLIAGGKARFAVRAQLRLDDHDVALSLLQKPVLVIVATDLDGLSTTQEVRDPNLVDEREFVHEIQVPERLVQLQVLLRGTVKNLAGTDVDLSTDATTFAINGIDASTESGTPLLLRTADGYMIELRGKNGERQPGRDLVLELHHRDYQDGIRVGLQTDNDGRIRLGDLPGIAAIDLEYHGQKASFANLATATCRLPTELHGTAGATLRMPYQGTLDTVSRAEFSLLGDDRDQFEHLAMQDGYLELRGLPPGNYELRAFATDTRIPVLITRGAADGQWLIGRDRMLEASTTTPLQVRDVTLADGTLRVQLGNATADTRVHVVATRFLPAFDPFTSLRGAAAHVPSTFDVERLDSTYHAGRKLGDEYRYVLERRFTTKYPGNMLARPSLLLNPWALEDSANAPVGLSGGAGGRFGGRGGGKRGASAKNQQQEGGGSWLNPGTIANLDYFPRGSSLIANLVPDNHGVVSVPEAALGDGQIVHVVALDGDQEIYRSIVRPEHALTPRARTLPQSLDVKSHLTEQKRIEFVAAGGTAVLADARSAEVEIHDSLASVFRLFGTLSHDPQWSEFAFVTQWPRLSDADKRKLYSEHACHELSFFLYQKDRAFFDGVIKPFLTNKLDKTFLDHWLLGDDLTGYVEPWAFEQLNLIEKVLLAQRLEGDAKASVARLVKEQLELKPVDHALLDRLFGLALKSDELSDKDGAVRTLSAMKAAAPAEKAAEPMAADREAVVEEQAKEQPDKPARQAEAKTGSDDFYLGDTRRNEVLARKKVRALYRAVNPTKLLVEQNYWHRRMANATADVVAPNQFWIDYATAPAGKPFVSSAIVEASNSFLEMMMALAVLDLPFEAGKHEVTADGDQRTLRAATPLLLVRKEVTKTEKAADVAPLLLGENFFRLDDRYRFDNGQRRDAFVQSEFLVDIAYGCQVVVTNPTSMPRTAEVLLQIPAGAIPVQRGFWTKGVTVELQPYGTQTVEYAFYFPKAGDFAHYPAHAAEKEKLAAFAEPRTLHVVDTPSTLDVTSWEHVSQQGTADDVMTFLDTHNVQRLDLDKIAWRMQDRDFFGSLLTKLRSRHVYQDTLWSYALLHRDLAASREYLEHATNFLQQCGAFLDSPLVVIDPKQRKQFEQIELDPLVHARAHRFGGQRVLGNQDLARQYLQLMTILGYHPTLDADDWLVVTYYFLLQDRVEEALQSFNKVDAQKVHTKLQYDYLSAYLCFFTGDTAKARQLAERHQDDPVPHWQKRFRDVLAQLDEIAGKAAAPGEPTADSLAATAPAIELAIEGKQVTLAYKNLAQCEVRYYELDVEFAFSAQPFASEGGTSAAFVQPNAKETRDLPQGQPQLTFELPKALQQKNVLVEVRAAGLVRSQQYLANNFDVRFLESYGQIAVTEPGTTKPLPQTYVKVFARLADGSVRFHKDGYTDLRGRFDYASVSDDPNANATKYAVLVLHDQRGAVIREVAPPAK